MELVLIGRCEPSNLSYSYLKKFQKRLMDKLSKIIRKSKKLKNRESELLEQFNEIIASEKDIALTLVREERKKELEQATETYKEQVAYIENLEVLKNEADEEAKEVGRLDVEINRKETVCI